MNRWIGHIGALFVMFVWGATFVNSKILLTNGLLPDEIFFLRSVQAYIILALFSHKHWLAHSWRDELIFLGLGIFGGSLYFLCENTALVYGSTANVSILVGSTPLLTALLIGSIYKSERLNSLQCFGSVIAFIGMVLVILNGQLILRLNPLGDTLALCASATWAVYSLLIRFVSDKYNTIFVTRKVFFYGLLTIIPVLLFSPKASFDYTLLAKPVIFGNLLFLGVLASSICYLIWNKVLKLIGTIRATNYIYMQSIVTMFTAKIVLDERITWMAILGVAVLISGLILVQRKPLPTSLTGGGAGRM